MEEIWKDVVGYEGIYQVSNLGRVKSLKFNKEKILKPGFCNGGYMNVTLRKSNSEKQKTVHQLVAMAFLNHIPDGHKKVIDHRNDIKTDNRVENLQVITNRENSYKTQGKYSSQYKAVCLAKDRNKWMARICINEKTVYLGLFNCELAASLAYQNKLKQIL